MRWLVVVFVILLGTSMVEAGTFTVHTIEHDGLTREVCEYVPTTISRPDEVIVHLHGGGADCENAGYYNGLIAKAEAKGVRLVMPQGVLTVWHACRPLLPVDDISFLDAVLDEFGAERVLMGGISCGGEQTREYACARPERLTAIYAVATAVRTQECEPGGPVPYVHFHGSDDPNLERVGGAASNAPPPQAEINGCTPMGWWPVGFTGGMVFVVGTGCDVPTWLFIHSYGHCWPGSPVLDERCAMLGSATYWIWKFFEEL